MKNLILTLANGLSSKQLKPFLHSFRENQPGTELVIFTNRISNKDLEIFRLYGATCKNFNYSSIRMRHLECLLWPFWRILFSKLSNNKIKIKIAKKAFNLFFLRNILYWEYLKSVKQKPKWVLLTDSRDVLFQGNLFAGIYKKGLYVFGEGKNRTIGKCEANRRMLRNCCGEEEVQRLSGYEPLCAGTVLGDYLSVLSYLEAMVFSTMRVKTMRMVPGDDQGLHNYIIRNNKVPNVIYCSVEDGPIGTLGALHPSEIRRSASHLVLQMDGRPYALLHQQDRHQDILLSHPMYRELDA